jgi:spermidine synthase
MSFEKMDWHLLNVEKVLVLGLGLGSVPQMLEKKFNKQFEYHLVEIDEVIIGLAQEYILTSLKSPMQIIHTDAMVYLNVCREKYDLIIMDIFEDNKVPKIFETKEAVSGMKNLLAKNGCLLYNRLNINDNDFEETKLFYESVFKNQFPDAYFLELPTNIMLCSRNDILMSR